MSEEPENWARLHPSTLAIRALERLPELVLGLPAAAYFIGNTGIVVALFLAVAGLAVSMLFAFVYWRRFTYWVGPEQLVIESGIVNRNRRTIPFDRIQDVSLEQKLLARLFGVSIVRIETGGSGGDEGELDCVSRAEADRLRDRIRAYRAVNAEREDTAGAGEGGAPRPLYEMDFRRLVAAGLFNFSLVFLAILGGVWQYLGSYLPAEYWDPARWIGAYRKEAVGLISALSILSFAMLLLLVGITTGVMRTIARDFGFRLTRTETGLRRQRGLFTRTDVVIPLRRVQAGIVSTGLVKRLFGWSGLAVQSLGSDGDAGTHHDVAPLATPNELVPVLDELTMPLPPAAAEFTRVSPKMMWRSWIRGGAAFILAASCAAIFWSDWPLLLLIVPFLVIVPVLQYRAHGYCFRGDILFVRRGFLRPRVTILPLVKLQSVTLVRGPVQRGLGAATLAIGTAGAPLATPLNILDLEADDARRLLGANLAGA